MHRYSKGILWFVGITLCITAAGAPGPAQTRGKKLSTVSWQPLATEERLRSPGWWPTKSTPLRDEYLGPAACAECHSSRAATQPTTPMAKACARAADSEVLATHERLSFRLGPYLYEIARADGRSVYTVSDDGHSVSAPLGWAFGEGEVGETYVFTLGGVFYESQFSYFPALGATDFSPGHSHAIPSDLEGAIGRKLDADETHLCFGCHNTASSTGGQFDPAHLIPGVTCEACHGPGAKHVAAVKEGRFREGMSDILNPSRLTPVDLVDFCGACHHTWADVVEGGGEGAATLRFQPYRLELSRCWGKVGDPRIVCLACHDPHQPLAHDASSYDQACLRCHLGGAGGVPTQATLAPARGDSKVTGGSGAADNPGKACPRATRDCVTCHMPKGEVPDTHTKFTDHWIHIVRSHQD